jgi:hypothetical protein
MKKSNFQQHEASTVKHLPLLRKHLNEVVTLSKDAKQ